MALPVVYPRRLLEPASLIGTQEKIETIRVGYVWAFFIFIGIMYNFLHPRFRYLYQHT